MDISKMMSQHYVFSDQELLRKWHILPVTLANGGEVGWGGDENGRGAPTGCAGDSAVRPFPASSHWEFLCLYFTVFKIIDVLMENFASLSSGLWHLLQVYNKDAS